MYDVFGKTLSGSRSLDVDDLTIGTVSITQQYSTVPYQLQLPPIQGIPNSFLTNNGSGILTWRDETTLPYIEEVGITTPSFLTVTNSPITPTSISPIISITADSTGTGAVVLQTSPTFLTSITTPQINNPGSGLDLTIAATGPFSDIIISSTNGNIQVNAPSIFIGGNKYPTIPGNAQNLLETDGLGNLSWSATTGNGNVVKASNATLIDTTIDGLTLTDPLPTTSGGTGLDTIGTSGQYLVSNGTSLYWETGQQLGIMRYKQTYFPYFYITPPAGMQLWYGGNAFVPSNLDFRTLYPVSGAQYGLALTYGYEANFGRFVNEYDFPVIVEINYSVARFQPGIPVVETGAGAQYDSALAFFTTTLNGGTAFYIEKNNNGDALATTSSASGEFCNGSVTLVLQPDDFFQLRGSTTSTIVGLFNVESEIFIKLQSMGATGPVYAPSTPGSGTVTSVNIASPDAFFAVGGGPITTSGTLSVALSGTALPTTAGGTGLITVGANGTFLTSNGTTLSWQVPPSSITSVSASAPLASSGGSTPTISFTGTLAVANGGTGVTTSTGTGAVVLNSNPSFGVINTPYIEGSDAFGDIKINSTRYIFLDADTATVIGSNNYPNGTGVAGQVLYTNGGGTLFWATPPGGGVGGGTVTSVGVNTAATSGFLLVNGGTSATVTSAGVAALTLGTLPVLNGGTGVTTSTGTGSVVLSASPTMTGALTLPQITGSGGGFGDLTLSSTRNIILSASTAIAIGATNFPLTAGTNGQVLTTNGGGVGSWSSTPILTTITGSGGGFGDLTLTSARNIYLNAATSVVIGSNTYPVAVGSAGQVLMTNGAPGVVSWQTLPTGQLKGSGECTLDLTTVTGGFPAGVALSQIATFGTGLTAFGGASLRNQTGGSVTVTVYFSCARNGGSASGSDIFYLQKLGYSQQYGYVVTAPFTRHSSTTIFRLANNESFSVYYDPTTSTHNCGGTINDLLNYTIASY